MDSHRKRHRSERPQRNIHRLEAKSMGRMHRRFQSRPPPYAHRARRRRSRRYHNSGSLHNQHLSRVIVDKHTRQSYRSPRSPRQRETIHHFFTHNHINHITHLKHNLDSNLHRSSPPLLLPHLRRLKTYPDLDLRRPGPHRSFLRRPGRIFPRAAKKAPSQHPSRRL